MKEGDFVMVTREIIRALSDKRIVRLTTDEKSICLVLLEKTIGQHVIKRGITAPEFLAATGISRATVFESLSSLLEKGVLVREKLRGIRATQYGLNEEFFGRIYPGEVSHIYYLDKFREEKSEVREVGRSKSESADFKSPTSRTNFPRLAAVGANSAIPNISSNIFPNISLREMREFLDTRSTNTKKRWAELIGGILSSHSEDESLLMLAIDTVTKTNKDFLGRPIRSSALSLFESTDWLVIRGILMDQIKRQREEEEKVKRKEENERVIAATRQKLKNEVDVSSISPVFRKFAHHE